MELKTWQIFVVTLCKSNFTFKRTYYWFSQLATQPEISGYKQQNLNKTWHNLWQFLLSHIINLMYLLLHFDFYSDTTHAAIIQILYRLIQVYNRKTFESSSYELQDFIDVDKDFVKHLRELLHDQKKKVYIETKPAEGKSTNFIEQTRVCLLTINKHLKQKDKIQFILGFPQCTTWPKLK